jgi:hypothetical protein
MTDREQMEREFEKDLKVWAKRFDACFAGFHETSARWFIERGWSKPDASDTTLEELLRKCPYLARISNFPRSAQRLRSHNVSTQPENVVRVEDVEAMVNHALREGFIGDNETPLDGYGCEVLSEMLDNIRALTGAENRGDADGGESRFERSTDVTQGEGAAALRCEEHKRVSQDRADCCTDCQMVAAHAPSPESAASEGEPTYTLSIREVLDIFREHEHPVDLAVDSDKVRVCSCLTPRLYKRAKEIYDDLPSHVACVTAAPAEEEN